MKKILPLLCLIVSVSAPAKVMPLNVDAQEVGAGYDGYSMSSHSSVRKLEAAFFDQGLTEELNHLLVRTLSSVGTTDDIIAETNCRENASVLAEVSEVSVADGAQIKYLDVKSPGLSKALQTALMNDLHANLVNTVLYYALTGSAIPGNVVEFAARSEGFDMHVAVNAMKDVFSARGEMAAEALTAIDQEEPMTPRAQHFGASYKELLDRKNEATRAAGKRASILNKNAALVAPLTSTLAITASPEQLASTATTSTGVDPKDATALAAAFHTSALSKKVGIKRDPAGNLAWARQAVPGLSTVSDSALTTLISNLR